MAYKIDNTVCVSCRACYDQCIADAILNNNEIFTIDEEKCIECGECQNTCPIDAIYLDD